MVAHYVRQPLGRGVWHIGLAFDFERKHVRNRAGLRWPKTLFYTESPDCLHEKNNAEAAVEFRILALLRLEKKPTCPPPLCPAEDTQPGLGGNGFILFLMAFRVP